MQNIVRMTGVQIQIVILFRCICLFERLYCSVGLPVVIELRTSSDAHLAHVKCDFAGFDHQPAAHSGRESRAQKRYFLADFFPFIALFMVVTSSKACLRLLNQINDSTVEIRLVFVSR